MKKHEEKKEPNQPKGDEKETVKDKAEEYKESLQRLQAEFENYAKRTEKEKQEYRKFLNAQLIEDFLPLMDTLGEGTKHAQKNGNREMKEGFEKAEKQLEKILERNGARKIETIGKKFNSELHESLMTANEKEKDDEMILEEFQKGYTLHDKILRPAKVRVNKRE